MKILDAKAVVGKEWEKARGNPSMELGKIQEQEGSYSGCTWRQQESPLCFIDGLMSPQKR